MNQEELENRIVKLKEELDEKYIEPERRQDVYRKLERLTQLYYDLYGN